MANCDLKIHVLCLLTVLLLNLRPSITILSSLSTWVSFHIQISSPCLQTVVLRIDDVAICDCCVQNHSHSLGLLLSLCGSVFPSRFWSQPKVYGVGFFPSSNGVCRFSIETFQFYYNRVCVPRIWDPGILFCCFVVYLLNLQKHQLFYNQIVFSKVIEKQYVLIYIDCFWWLKNGSARYTMDSMDMIDSHVVSATEGKPVTWVNKLRREHGHNPLGLTFDGEEDEGLVPLFHSTVNSLQYRPNPPFQLDLIWLGRLPCRLRRHWKRNLVRKQPGMRRHWIFTNDHSETLPELSSISISRRQQNLESFPTTLDLFFLVKLMSMTFGSFSSKLIAFKKCVKGGLNRFYLLPVRLINSRVTSTPSLKLCQFHVFAYTGCIGLLLYFVNTF